MELVTFAAIMGATVGYVLGFGVGRRIYTVRFVLLLVAVAFLISGLLHTLVPAR